MPLTSASPLSITASRELSVALGGGGETGGVSPNYTPMVAEDFAAGTVGQTYSDGSWKANYSIIDDSIVIAPGSKSLKVIAETYDGIICGGPQDSYFGGRQTLPEKVTPGYSIWYAMDVFFPESFSWGYVYQNNLTSDENDAAACGISGDSDGNTTGLKFMRLSESTSGGRNYLYLPTHRREKSLPDDAQTMLLNSEAEGVNEVITAEAARIVPGTWQRLQFEVRVSDSGQGSLRAWKGSTFLGERLNIDTCTSAQGGLDEWAIGTHWNGGHYSDTGAEEHKAFYVAQVIVASDMPGYGAPNAADSGGRPFIHPETMVGDFAP